ncbi:Protein BOI2 [Escovopsis weberi]|uniref:Protein BOI2 n=1 Tax=Escovopsis weberi TaxID=150374 RepID=A0A0M9VV21_ESCWE|nr:Protein BOI2 [Escovopsis weberi]
MAARNPSEKPDIGDILMVIHDFLARSSDELSLKKGDRVELLERDDEFGDGWFLGRHIVNNNTGLFPEVYTRPAPRNTPVSPAALNSQQPLAPLVEVTQENVMAATADAPLDRAHALRPPRTPSEQGDPSGSLPMNSARSGSTSNTAFSSRTSPSPTPGQLPGQGQDNQVLNETLNVINEHITHLRSSPSASALHHSATDSSSEYSGTLDHRMSYIQGEETDEEEDGAHTRAEVEAWTPDEVAEYLFASGVERHHCDVFKDQEISGEVILGMDQSSLFIKAFDLGSVGRRLKTWHKIKTLQDEVDGQGSATRRTTQTYASDGGAEEARHTRSRTSTLSNSISKRPSSVQTRRMSMTQSTRASPPNFGSSAGQSISSRYQESPTRPHTKRPSAASIRELNHFRRHSSTDNCISISVSNATSSKAPATASSDVPHKKQPSFDRNWTLGGALTQPTSRPLSSTGLNDKLILPSDPELQDSAVDMDRGYFSGTEVDGRKRNVLKKRESADHSKKQSYTEEQRVRSATALSKHSRYGSIDSFRDAAAVSPAAQKYYGVQQAPHRRTASSNTAESARPLPPAKDGPAPTVTKLEMVSSPVSMEASPNASKSHSFNADWLTSAIHKPGSKTSRPMRAISDRLTFDRSKSSPSTELSTNDPSMTSLTRTGSGTPSVNVSLDLDPSDAAAAKSPTSATNPAKTSRKKGKKGTSAYTRGLLKVTPQEAMKDADYYGWMRKKSSNLMTTWKPRLFVLKGRRLAYYYSEHDDSEKGLIDISFHRVLPADSDKLTGLHATITGAVVGPGIPSNQSVPGGSEGTITLEKGDDSTFIFKLVPPRAGLSKAVNFTKPTVHYFAVPNLKQGRLWMAALMKASIERDDTQPITTTYQQKTISLTKAKQMRHRPPALMNLEEATEDEKNLELAAEHRKLMNEADSGVSGLDKIPPRIENRSAPALNA